MEAVQQAIGVRSSSPAEGKDGSGAAADGAHARVVSGGPEGESVIERPVTSNPSVISRRAALGGGLAGLAGLGGLLLFPAQVLARVADQDESFVILLKGPYRPVVHGPDLGLSRINLNDGSYSTTKIYSILGTPGNANLTKPIGHFYVQFVGDLCAYAMPGGTIAMRFTDVVSAASIPDGLGGQFLDATADLTIPEATGKFRRFVGGHNLMIDRLHALAPGDGSGGFDEYCFCFVSGKERENGRAHASGRAASTTLERAIRRAGSDT